MGRRPETELQDVLLKQVSAASWRADCERLRSNWSSADKEASSRITARLATRAISRGRSNEAIIWTSVSILLADGALNRLGEEFRPSTINAAPRKLSYVFSRAAEELGTPTAVTVERLRSWANFAELFEVRDKIETAICNALKGAPIRSLHWLLRAADSRFIEGAKPPSITTNYPVSIDAMDADQFSSAVSAILECYAKARGFDWKRAAQPPNIRQLERVLVDGYWLRELFEWELLVFRMGFGCLKESDGEFLFTAPDRQTGVVLSHGYHQAHHVATLRAQLDLHRADTFSASCETILGRHAESLAFKLITDDPRPHFRYRFTEALLKDLFTLVNRPMPYSDEMAELRIACNYLKTSSEDLLGLSLPNGGSVGDALRLQRVLGFLARGRQHSLVRQSESTDHDEAQVFVMEREQLLKFVEFCGFSRKIADGLLQALVWHPKSVDFLDLHYRPFIVLGDRLVAPLALAARINIFRNLLWSLKVRPPGDTDSEDSTTAQVISAFARAGVRHWRNLSYTFRGMRGELDAVAVIGDRVFVFEAKHTPSPCSAFELRSTWRHIERATEQLDRFRSAFGDSNFRKTFGSQLRMDLSGAQLTTSIVLNHVVLSGATVGGHAIRAAGELSQFVTSGDTWLILERRRHVIKCRSAGPVSADDLHSYLTTGGLVHEPVQRASIVQVRALRLHGVTIRVAEYGFDPIAHLAFLNACTPEVQMPFEAAVRRVRELDERNTGVDDAEFRGAYDDMIKCHRLAMEDIAQHAPREEGHELTMSEALLLDVPPEVGRVDATEASAPAGSRPVPQADVNPSR